MAKYQEMIGGFQMPSVGLGTWNIKDENELQIALNSALELGYRHIDTAYVYRNEAFIGKVLKKWFSSGKLKREDIFVTTKLPHEAVHPDRVEKYMKMSLEALQLDYVDLYLIHTPVLRENIDGKWEARPTDHVGVWKKMEEQVDAGRTKAIGLSNFSIEQTENVWNNARIKPSCLQVRISPFYQQPDLVKYCHEKGIVVVGYSTLGSPGIMEDRPNFEDVLNNESIIKIATKHNRSAAQVILRYFLEKNVVMIPKSITPSRIKENLDLFSFNLQPEDVKTIEKLNK